MAHTVLKASISFGLVSVPVKLSVAARGESVSFNMLHSCGSRVNQKLWCPQCDKEISRSETTKGYEVSPDTYVTVEPDELKALTEESTKVIEIEDMVPVSEVDPLLFESSYFAEPEPAGRKGYQLLTQALELEGRYAIARVTMSGREQIVVIRPYRGQLALHTIYYANEVRAMPTVDKHPVSKPELALARKLVMANAATFQHEEYEDKYSKAVLDLIETKAAGKTPKKIAPKKQDKAPADIMAALEASLKKPRAKKAA